MKKLNIALLMGGDSREYEISIASAGVVNRYLDPAYYNVFPIHIRNAEWTFKPEEGKILSIDKNDFTLQIRESKISFDCAFIAIHGTPGEDGKLQGYLEMMGIPYTTCDMTTSALTFNKYFCNDLAKQYGVDVAKTVLLKKAQKWNSDELIAEVGLPCFVKPNKSGSSVGVSKISLESDFEKAIQAAFEADDEVLVQQYIKGREMACGVFRRDGQIVLLPVTEIISKNDFFDYEAKYTAGMADEITPASISTSDELMCRKITSYLYEKFNCKGIVRFDYFLSEEKWWFLEVNTVPGLSEGSIVPKQAKAAGIGLSELFDQLIREAVKS